MICYYFNEYLKFIRLIAVFFQEEKAPKNLLVGGYSDSDDEDEDMEGYKLLQIFIYL